MKLSTGQWQTIFGVAAAVVAYLLIQTDVTLYPIVKVLLGSATVALAVLSPKGIAVT